MEKYCYEYNYPIEYYSPPHAHLEYQNHLRDDLSLNEAEIKALQQEEYKNKNEEIKKIKKQRFIDNCNKNAQIYQEEEKMKNKEEEYMQQTKKQEKLLKNQNFNKNVYEKNMRPFSHRIPKSKTLNKNTKSFKKNNNKMIKVINHINENQNENDNNIYDNNFNEQFIPKKRILENINNQGGLYDDNVQYGRDTEKDIFYQNFNDMKKNADDENNNNNIKIILNKNNENNIANLNSDYNNNNIVDLRANIEEQLMQELKMKNNKNKNNEINEEISDKMSSIKRFRVHGVLPRQNAISEKKKKKTETKKKKFFSEFERRRFIKALKNIFTERLGEHNIYIQNICNCGNLQNQLTALVEKGNLTVYALTEVECANNCVFYKNKKAYLKAINDVLKSIKNIAYENFHNKYKDRI